jgi:hypothetical protein
MSRIKRAEIDLDIAIRSLQKIIRLMNEHTLPVNENYTIAQHENDTEIILKAIDLLTEFTEEIEAK